MNIGLRRQRVWLFAAFVLAALIALLPMRLALAVAGIGNSAISVRSVSGAVWLGRLEGLHVADTDLGDVRARLAFWPLLIGQVRLDLRGLGPLPVDQPGAAPLAGAVIFGWNSVGIAGVTAAVPAGAVFGPLPVTRVDLDGVSVRFDGGKCAVAEGRVKAALGGAVAGIPLSQGVSGAAKCQNGRLLLPLVSQAGTESISLSIDGAGRYRATLSIQSVDPALADKLMLAGFQQNGAGYALSVDGRF